ncbi:MAG: thiamine pyrophosphate-binding protein [Pirellulales bacterium]
MLRGIDAFLEILHDAGVRKIFGNPGTTELPLNDALCIDTRFEYILGLQEVAVMAMADGYAMAGGRVGVVNLHICPGLGHAMGLLYNAFREGTPLLVTAGQQDTRLSFEEPILGGDMVGVAQAVDQVGLRSAARAEYPERGASRIADRHDPADRTGFPVTAAGRAVGVGRVGSPPRSAIATPAAARSGRRYSGRRRAVESEVSGDSRRQPRDRTWRDGRIGPSG